MTSFQYVCLTVIVSLLIVEQSFMLTREIVSLIKIIKKEKRYAIKNAKKQRASRSNAKRK